MSKLRDDYWENVLFPLLIIVVLFSAALGLFQGLAIWLLLWISGGIWPS